MRERRVPFVNGDVSGVDVKLRVAGSLAALLFVSFTLAFVERLSFESVTGYAMAIGIPVGLIVCLAVFDRASSRPALTLDLDEQPPLPTQRLSLAE